MCIYIECFVGRARWSCYSTLRNTHAVCAVCGWFGCRSSTARGADLNKRMAALTLTLSKQPGVMNPTPRLCVPVFGDVCAHSHTLNPTKHQLRPMVMMM